MPSLTSINHAFLIGFYVGVIALSFIGTVGGPLVILWLFIRFAHHRIASVANTASSATRSMLRATFALAHMATRVRTLPVLPAAKKPTTQSSPGSPAQ